MTEIPGAPKWMTLQDIRGWIMKRSVRRGGCLIVAGFGSQRGVYQKGPGRAWTHAASFVAFGGQYVEGLDVAHSCSAKDCAEPSHLGQKTHAQNCLEDSMRRALRVTCPHPRIRHPETRRLARCRECNRASQQAWRDRNTR